MQTPNALPGFWIFMYRVSPLTYLIAGMCGNALHGQEIQCSNAELSVFSPPQGMTCGQYLEDWLAVSPSQLLNPSAKANCEMCAFTTADQYMALSDICKWRAFLAFCLLSFRPSGSNTNIEHTSDYSQRWRNYGIGWAYIGFNIAGAVLLYYIFRVRHYKPTLVPSAIKACGRVLHRLFRRRSGTVPQEKQADSARAL